MSKFTELSLEYYSCHHNLVSVAIWNLEPLAHARSGRRPAATGVAGVRAPRTRLRLLRAVHCVCGAPETTPTYSDRASSAVSGRPGRDTLCADRQSATCGPTLPPPSAGCAVVQWPGGGDAAISVIHAETAESAMESAGGAVGRESASAQCGSESF